MKSDLIVSVALGVVVSALALVPIPVIAEESVEDLKAQVSALQKRVAELEAPPAALPSPPQAGTMNRGTRDIWDPLSEMQRMHSEMEHLFQDSFNNPGVPANGVFSNHLMFQSSGLEQTRDGYQVQLNLKGFDKDKVDIKVHPGSLSVSARQQQETTQHDPTQHLEAQSFGEFMQTISLPKDADVSKMTTEKKGDDLIIRLPRKV